MPASIPCTTAGEIASAARPVRVRPNSTCTTPAATVIAQVTPQPKRPTRSATTTVRPAAGPLTCSGEPPRAPATRPPTAAAISPAVSGASEATAMPSESGTATRKTTREAGRSWRRFERSFSRQEGVSRSGTVVAPVVMGPPSGAVDRPGGGDLCRSPGARGALAGAGNGVHPESPAGRRRRGPEALRSLCPTGRRPRSDHEVDRYVAFRSGRSEAVPRVPRPGVIRLREGELALIMHGRSVPARAAGYAGRVKLDESDEKDERVVPPHPHLIAVSHRRHAAFT